MFRDLEPPGEALKRAIRWIGEQRLAHPRANTSELIDEASRRYELTPAEEEFLYIALKVKVEG